MGGPEGGYDYIRKTMQERRGPEYFKAVVDRQRNEAERLERSSDESRFKGSE